MRETLLCFSCFDPEVKKLRATKNNIKSNNFAESPLSSLSLYRRQNLIVIMSIWIEKHWHAQSYAMINAFAASKLGMIYLATVFLNRGEHLEKVICV